MTQTLLLSSWICKGTSLVRLGMCAFGHVKVTQWNVKYSKMSELKCQNWQSALKCQRKETYEKIILFN